MIPFVATYRLQLNNSFTFADASKVVPYLARLGISHLYLSPIWQARPGSAHGYDVIDPTRISDELGGEEGFRALHEVARSHGLGIVLDVVPNHMAIDDDNELWTNEATRHQVFDIDEATSFRRRFFDVDELGGVKVEDPEVFDLTHKKAIELVKKGLVDGLRVDHIDGLADPTAYLRRLTQHGVRHVWVEKILEVGEELPPWPVEGTTGYDFMNDVTALFVDPTSEGPLDDLYGEKKSFEEFADEAKVELATTTFMPEVNALLAIAPVDDIALALASLPIYRTYCTVDPTSGAVSTTASDRVALEHLPFSVRSIFEPELSMDAPLPPETVASFVTRFQQISGPVMAKGVEDTALYRYVRLLALNEVGGNPQRYSINTAQFHAANKKRQTSFPRSMLASQTHDTKRSGDVRSRLIALTRMSEDWVAAVRRWHELTASFRSNGAPDWTDELFIYQTLLGAWPIGSDRLVPYLQKALREAKRHTNWLSPNEAYEATIMSFSEKCLTDPTFLSDFAPFAERLMLAGEKISLAQLVLRLSAPGIPDNYQGDEFWNLSLVDPDNRRTVSWSENEHVLSDIESGIDLNRDNAKLFTTRTMLHLRQRQGAAFAGSYRELSSSATTCAFQRDENVVVTVDVRGVGIAADLPEGEWNDLLAPLHRVYPKIGVAVYEKSDAIR